MALSRLADADHRRLRKRRVQPEKRLWCSFGKSGLDIDPAPWRPGGDRPALVVFDGVVPVRDDMMVVWSPLHHAFAN
jgi:hypothetical protein